MTEFDMCGEPIFIDISKAPGHYGNSIALTNLNTNDEFVPKSHSEENNDSQDDISLIRSANSQTEKDNDDKSKVIEQACVKIEPRRIKCTECQRFTAETEEKMLRHIRKVHRGENPYQCYMCDYSTYNSVLFEEHVRIHQGIKPYKCTHCPYRSVSKKNTKKHELIHRPDNPLRCKNCDFIGRNSRSLNKHSLTHSVSNVKWFKCDTCRFKTTSNLKLKNHKRLHEYPCKRCGFVAHSNSLLRKHLQVDHEVELPGRSISKIFKCSQCKWSSKCKSRILLHLIHHPNQIVDETLIDISILRKYDIMR